MIRPFKNWTLICDLNTKIKIKTCNVLQEIVDRSGSTIFSWSLAATKEGDPLMIMRFPPNVVGTAGLDMGDGKPAAPVALKGCGPTICLAYLPLDQRLRTAIKNEAVVRISYGLKSSGISGRVSFQAPLAGLSQALAAI